MQVRSVMLRLQSDALNNQAKSVRGRLIHCTDEARVLNLFNHEEGFDYPTPQLCQYVLTMSEKK